ncbi:Crp/Fnr family transcriptional regulator [Radiobacillus sp. PE A8.2]|uniref:Crp/Fnr family transcriptional regulator n=1 Tax=Radiobacillus sp. PE A8.2 TaxID=3380349 RepID=UPI00388E6060
MLLINSRVNLALSSELKDLLTGTELTIQINKNQFLFQQGEDVNEVYIIQSGTIQIGKSSPDGRELTLRICKKGDIIGELAVYSDNVKYLLNAKAMEDSQVVIIKKHYLEEKLLHNPQLAMEFMKAMSDNFRREQTKIRDLVMNGKKGALYSTLIRLSNSYGIELTNGILIDIMLTNQEIANFCGTSRESVNRMLSDLKREKIIDTQHNKIIIYNLQHLKDEINCENCPIVLCSID